jgi:glycine/D-amino acid oxidase-like deaminating enzyme
MDILILGAGVAGAAAAIALRRRGHAVRVVERRARVGALGAGVVLWPNAGFVLSELGLLERVAALGGTPPAKRRMDSSGRMLTRLDIGALDRAMGCASHAVLRRDLQAVLLAEMARLGVQLHCGAAAVALRATGEGAAAAPGASGRGDFKAALAGLFAGWPEPVGRVIAHWSRAPAPICPPRWPGSPRAAPRRPPPSRTRGGSWRARCSSSTAPAAWRATRRRAPPTRPRR